jgi:hypothetical protein
MAGKQVVARYKDGRVAKGCTTDFSPVREFFHLEEPGGMAEIRMNDLKAVFFVRDLVGDSRHMKSNLFAADQRVIGRKISIEFDDGEILVGTTQGYRPDRLGFFVEPADTQGNAERCFVVKSATRQVRMF